MKDFQKRNKMSMQFLLMDQERKYINNLRKATKDAAEDTFTSELYDENSYFDIEREPEIEQNVSTSMFIKNTIENLAPALTNDIVSTDIGSEMNNYKVKGEKLTTKQQLLKEVGAVISSNRSNVGRRLKRRKASVSIQGNYENPHMEVASTIDGGRSFKAKALLNN